MDSGSESSAFCISSRGIDKSGGMVRESIEEKSEYACIPIENEVMRQAAQRERRPSSSTSQHSHVIGCPRQCQ
eukprot:3375433-Pyramimonas_sp.AAC.1